ncbi:MAG: hypothetical protein LQ341_004504, partial [Variospora aurantia]
MILRPFVAARPISHLLRRTHKPTPTLLTQIRTLTQADIDDPGMVRNPTIPLHHSPTNRLPSYFSTSRTAATPTLRPKSANSATPTPTGGTSRSGATSASPSTRTTTSSASSPRTSTRTSPRKR